MPDLFLPSLLDRLESRSSGPSGQPPASQLQGVGLEQYRAMVVRDLGNLLNHPSFFSSNWRGSEPTPGAGLVSARTHPHVAKSVLNYGVDLPTGMTASPEVIEQLQRNLRDAIECFEPRLRNVRVELATGPSQTGPAPPGKGSPTKCWFAIEADLLAEPYPDRIHLTTEVDLISGEFYVPGGKEQGQRSRVAAA